MFMADVTRIAWRSIRSKERFHPHALIDAFRLHLGPTGTLLIPTYTFDLVDGASFDRRGSHTISGSLGKAALEHPAFGRTGHPLHSFAVAGQGREHLMTVQERGSFGPGSPFSYAHEHGGLLVTLDLEVNRALTFSHFVEERERVPYRFKRTMSFQYTDLDGSTMQRSFDIQAKKAGHRMNFSSMEGLLERSGALRRGAVEGIQWRVIDLVAAYPVIAEDLRKDSAGSVHLFRCSWWLKDVARAALFTIMGRPQGIR